MSVIADAERARGGTPFVLHLDNFDGPFDLLLQLIAKHKLDVTEVALSQVTDEFIAHLKAAGDAWDLDQTSSFLVIAATLLDLKAARLLPQGEVDDADDLALLEARDLLFARLLQYRAFKLISGWFATRLGEQASRFARPGGWEPAFAALLPEVSLVSPQRLARVAARTLEPAPVAEVGLSHLHQSTVSVSEQAQVVVGLLRQRRQLSFTDLVAGADRLTTVVRFLALLELFREAVISFEQLTPLGVLTVRWIGDDHTEVEIADEFDQPAPNPDQAADGSDHLSRLRTQAAR